MDLVFVENDLDPSRNPDITDDWSILDAPNGMMRPSPEKLNGVNLDVQ